MEDVRIPLPASPTKFLDQFRVFIRTDGKSYSTENTYVYWVKQFILFNNKAHPQSLGNQEVEAFLTHLSVAKDASPNTQKLALNALMFLYNRFLNTPIEQLNFKYAKKPIRTPTVFTHEEAMSVIDCMVMPYKLLAQLMYGCGLRVSEALRLRVKDVDFAMGYIVIRDGKGFKDRTTLLPKSIISDLKKQIDIVQNLLEYDKTCGIAGVYMPNMLEKKYPSAGHSLGWQFLFPGNEPSKDPRTNLIRRHHIYPTTIQSHVKHAIKKVSIHKHASCHTFRHSFATRLLQAKYDLKQIQTLMGHTDIRTTEIYLHVLDELGDRVKSPLDA
ncbi:integron integrase [Cellvibrio sp. BR]|uniref:integron integrase n=1 Tax=Cellvibrio sp. BR TaxID=1134474 RepID=UPI0002600B12|nr:integron integrase [Cellvibrio sp. BR]EIK43142.1 integron integrase [Cellvibrio sp. BR]